MFAQHCSTDSPVLAEISKDESAFIAFSVDAWKRGYCRGLLREHATVIRVLNDICKNDIRLKQRYMDLLNREEARMQEERTQS